MNVLKSIQSRFVGAALITTALLGLASCNAFDEHLEPCPQGVVLRFIYDYNLEFANAFPSQVDCLTLFVYDGDGKYIATRTETSDILADENYRMTLDLPEGKYRFIAYGGMACDKSSFRFVSTPAAGSDITDLTVELNPSLVDINPGVSLHPLFYGSLDVAVETGSTDYVYATLPMMKDTNNLRVVLQQVDGEPVKSEDFSMKVIDDNTLMAWNNDVIPTTPATYNPWASGQVSSGLNPDGTEVIMAYGEMSFPRLVTKNSPRLLINRTSDGASVVDIPLINYLLALKSDVFANMPAQEFLDRESRWSMIFFLDRQNKWISVQIQVADWVVRINNTEL